MTKKQINISIVDDHNLFRKGLIKLITMGDEEGKYHIQFEAEDGLKLQESLKAGIKPDILLLDIQMPNMDGFETIQWLCENHPNIKVLVVSMVSEEESILKMLQAGVKGYLSKDIEVAEMHRALEAISNGGLYYSGFVSDVMSNINKKSANKGIKNRGRYKDSELKFLKLCCTDLTYHVIADQMNLAPKTIDGYRDLFFKEFGVKNRTSLAVYVIKHGIVSLHEL